MKKNSNNFGKIMRKVKRNAAGISIMITASLVVGIAPSITFASLTDVVDNYSKLFTNGDEMTPEDGSATGEDAVQTKEDGEQTSENGTDPDDNQTTENGEEPIDNPDDNQTTENGEEPIDNPDDNQTSQNGDIDDIEEPDDPTKTIEADISSKDDFVEFSAYCPDYIVDLSATTSIKPSIRKANKKYTIAGASSNNTKVAKVGKDGKVTLVGAGDATITLKLLSKDNELLNVTFNITATGKLPSSSEGTTVTQKKVISKASFKLGYTSVVYSGKKKTPTVTVKYGKQTLKNNKDYTVSYSSNINAGKAVVLIKGKGNYTGQKKLTFTINPRSIAKAKVTYSALSYVYNGKSCKPAIKKIMLGTTKLNSKNYTVTYSKNTKNVGTKSILIKGKGNYTGTIKKNYTIKPGKISKIKKTLTTDQVKLNWNKVKGVNGYEIYKYSPVKSKFIKVATTKSNSYTDKKLTSGTKNYYKIRTFVKTGKKKTYGDFSSVLQGVTRPVRVTTQFKIKGRKLTVLWKAIPGASGYEVYMSTGKRFTLMTDTKNLKYIKNDLKRNIKYSFKVRSYVKDLKGSKVYSDFGTTKSIKL